MSIFSSILARIFPPSHPAVAASSSTAPAGTATAPAPTAAPASAPTAAPAAAAGNAPTSTGSPTPAQAAAAPVDVEAIITKMPGASSLNWKTSIVDLLKVLGLDSSLEARKQLAHELGYTGNTQDSAVMNIWLHQEVVAKLAANGGKVPESMKS